MISALLACAACSDSGDDFADSVAPENKVNPGQMVIRLGRTLSRSYDLAANTRLFQFHADSVSLGNGAFVEEPALTPLGDDRLTFNLGEGVWNFSLVSSREPLEEGTIQKPEYGKRAQDCPMFSMTSEGGTLQSAPEIYTALVDNFRFSGKWQVTDPDHNIDEFVPDRDYTVDAQMLRNMAKIVVHFKSSEDLDPSTRTLPKSAPSLCAALSTCITRPRPRPTRPSPTRCLNTSSPLTEVSTTRLPPPSTPPPAFCASTLISPVSTRPTWLKTI